MELYHTSSSQITKIHRIGTFGSGLCFADEPYYMTCNRDAVCYRIEIDEDEILRGSSIFYQEDADIKLQDLIKEVAEHFECSESDARNIIDETENSCDFGGDAEDSFYQQRVALEAAKLLGYRGVQLIDEQGALYLIDMFGHEQDMQLVSPDDGVFHTLQS